MNLHVPPWAQWEVPPTIAAGLLGLLGAYLLSLGPWRPEEARTERMPRRQMAAFVGGLLTGFVALTGPLDDVADHFLFSAHMIQHLLLLLVVPPLLLAGTPSWLLRPLLRPIPLARLARFLTRPVVAYAVFNGLMVVWHLPVLYNWAVANEGSHIAMHLSFIAAGVVGWLPLLGSLPGLPRPSPPGQLLYAALMGLPMLVIAPLIAFSETVLYPAYGEMPRLWGLSPIEDQALGGFLMWVPAHLMFLVPLTIVFLQWVRREADTREERL